MVSTARRTTVKGLMGPAEGSDHLFLLPQRALGMDSTHLRQDLAGLDFNLHLLHTAPRGNVWLYRIMNASAERTCPICVDLLLTENVLDLQRKHLKKLQEISLDKDDGLYDALKEAHYVHKICYIRYTNYLNVPKNLSDKLLNDSESDAFNSYLDLNNYFQKSECVICQGDSAISEVIDLSPNQMKKLKHASEKKQDGLIEKLGKSMKLHEDCYNSYVPNDEEDSGFSEKLCPICDHDLIDDILEVTAKNREKLVGSSEKRQDDLARKIQDLHELLVHEKCFRSYNHYKNIAKAQSMIGTKKEEKPREEPHGDGERKNEPEDESPVEKPQEETEEEEPRVESQKEDSEGEEEEEEEEEIPMSKGKARKKKEPKPKSKAQKRKKNYRQEEAQEPEDESEDEPKPKRKAPKRKSPQEEAQEPEDESEEEEEEPKPKRKVPKRKSPQEETQEPENESEEEPEPKHKRKAPKRKSRQEEAQEPEDESEEEEEPKPKRKAPKRKSPQEEAQEPENESEKPKPKRKGPKRKNDSQPKAVNKRPREENNPEDEPQAKRVRKNSVAPAIELVCEYIKTHGNNCEVVLPELLGNLYTSRGKKPAYTYLVRKLKEIYGDELSVVKTKDKDTILRYVASLESS